MKIKFLFYLIWTLLIVSCAKERRAEVQYFPFQESTNGLWGMISPSGEKLFTEEFKEKPTIVRDGRFMVRNKDGLWEIYTAEAKPQKIGSEYAYANMFQDGIAIVAEKGKPVSLIDTDAKVIKLLDKIDGKAVTSVNAFSQGYAVYKSDKYYGVIDNKGNKVIDAKYLVINNYSDGKFIALDRKYEEEAKKDSSTNIKFDVLDTSGKVISSLSMAKYKDFGFGFREGLLDVYTEAKDEKCGGLINENGDVVIKLTPKIKKVGDIRNKHFTYNNGDGWGLMNLDGESVVRAKYDYLYFASDDILIAVTKKDGGSISYKYIDFKDNQIGEDTYDEAFPFYMFNDEYAIVKVSANLYSLIDFKCQQVKNLPDMVNVGFMEGDYTVESDYVDIKKLVDALLITEESVDSVSFKSSTSKVAKIYTASGAGSWRKDKEHPLGDPYWFTYTSELSYWRDINGVMPDIEINFTGDIAKRNYRTKRVIDYTYGDWYWYHNERIPLGYSYTDAKVKSFKLKFENRGKLRHKLRNVFSELTSRFKNMGTVEKENNGAMVVTLKNGKRALIAMEKDNVFVLWGDIAQAKSIDIDKYKDIKEEAGHIKDYDYFENKLEGIIEKSDSTEADSVAVVD
ncbi:MAG: WG repeat-containing protein [Prevotella sp.]|nr:WG repeat-containing protein [Prevotella sp.]MBQ8702721.1 WG repeat-containing protein [Prevotella sp.]